MPTAARHYRWDDIPKEKLNDLLDRRLVTGERIMLSHVYMKKGCIVPSTSTRTSRSRTSSKARCASGWAPTRSSRSTCTRARC